MHASKFASKKFAPKSIFAVRKSLALLPIVGLASIAQAAPAAKAPVKPAAKVTKPAARQVAKPVAKERTLIREVLGTEPLTGYEGALGETFTLGKNSPINFTLNKAEYSVSRVNIGDAPHFTMGGEKFLILHYTVHNPQKKNITYSYGQFLFKAVDATNVTRDSVGDVAREGTGETLNIDLHPGQKIDAYTAIKVAANGVAPKLIVQNAYERQTPIIRYDLRDKVTKLTAPFVDATDSSGANALKLVPAKAGEFYPVVDFMDARLDSISYSSDPIGGGAPRKGYRYCNVIFTLKNASRRSTRYSYSYFRADLKDSDGEKTDYNTSMLKVSRDEQAMGELQAGEEARVRFYFELPENVTAKTILLQYGYDRDARTYAFDAESIAPKS